MSVTAPMSDIFAAEPTPQERTAHQAYDALMQALARPGELRHLPEPGLAVAGECLLDLEVGFFASDVALGHRLARTGARPTVPERADYLFLPSADAEAIGDAVKARPGDQLYPDRAATLFLGARLGAGRRLRLSGPGVSGRREIRVDDVAPSFWTERDRVCRYPLGWDVFLLDGTQVIGLPRSTQVEADPWPM